MAETTLANLIEAVADAWGNYRTGTVDAGSDDTDLVDAAGLIEPDDYWIGHYLYVLTDAGGANAAPEGEERPITDYVQATATLTVAPAFSAALGAGDTYEILPLRRQQVIRAINRAIEHADVWFKHATDSATIDLDDETFEYTLPTAAYHLAQVWYRASTSTAWREISPFQWHVGGPPGSKKLYLNSMAGLDDDDGVVRLEYLARLDKLTDDDDTLGVGELVERECVDFVINYALHWLYMSQASAAPAADTLRSYLTLAEYRRETYREIRRRAGHAGPAGRIHGRYPDRSKG